MVNINIGEIKKVYLSFHGYSDLRFLKMVAEGVQRFILLQIEQLAQRNNIDEVRRLIESGVSVNSTNKVRQVEAYSGYVIS